MAEASSDDTATTSAEATVQAVTEKEVADAENPAEAQAGPTKTADELAEES